MPEQTPRAFDVLTSGPSRCFAAVDVHVRLVDDILCAVEPQQLLSPAECAHAQRINHLAARRAYVASRCLLRQSLSQACSGALAPADWRFMESSYGKPALAEGQPQLWFNLSHTHDAVALAISRHGEVGIDLEALEPAVTPLPDALTDRERARLGASKPDSIAGDFLALWCAKEAAAKALGLGTSLDFSRLEVALAHAEVRLRGGGDEIFPAISLRLEKPILQGRSYCLAVAMLPCDSH
jgi:4'-phosphopantetheinyl transferase